MKRAQQGVASQRPQLLVLLLSRMHPLLGRARTSDVVQKWKREPYTRSIRPGHFDLIGVARQTYIE